MLEVSGVTRRFGGVVAVKDVSFSVPEGQWLGIIGPNGAGKSTLFNLLGGQIRPTAGRILLDGTDITGMPAHRRFRLGLGRSFQIASLFGGISVAEQLSLAIRTEHRASMVRNGRDGIDVRDRLDVLLEQWGLQHVATRTRPDELSYGEQRRLELALALAGSPRLLLLDEPNVGLTSDECQDLLGRVRAASDGLTVVFVAHDMDMILGWSDRVLVMHFGEVVADEPPSRLLENQLVSEIYLGSHQIGDSVA